MSSVYHFAERKKLAGLESLSVISIADSINRIGAEKFSPYSRIFSKNNVSAHGLPEFLISSNDHKGITSDDLRRVDFQSIPSHSPRKFDIANIQNKIETIVNDIQRLYFLNETPANELTLLESQTLDIINGQNLDFAVTIKNRNISGDELSKLVRDKDLSRNIVNVFMQHLKQVNRTTNKHENIRLRVNITSVEFSESALIKGNLIKQQNLQMKSYDYFIFPIFHHYWRLLIHDTNNKIA